MSTGLMPQRRQARTSSGNSRWSWTSRAAPRRRARIAANQSLDVDDSLGSPLALIAQNNSVSDAWEYDPDGVAGVTEQSITQASMPWGGLEAAAAVAGCPLLGETLGDAYGELAT